MKKYLMIALMILAIGIGTPIVNAVELDLNSKNAILYNLDENKVLYEKDSKERRPYIWIDIKVFQMLRQLDSSWTCFYMFVSKSFFETNEVMCPLPLHSYAAHISTARLSKYIAGPYLMPPHRNGSVVYT